jgi:uncharacterized membrane protein
MKNDTLNAENNSFEEYDPELAAVLEKNIRTILRIRQQAHQKLDAEQKISEKITNFTGHLRFLYIHIFLIAVYVLFNLGIFGIRAFDPYPFGLLVGILTVEVLFLSTFILISQNRQQKEADQRADLDLQMSLLNQYELTRALRMLDAIQDKLGIPNDDDIELRELEEDVSPEDVLIEMDLVRRREEQPNHKKKHTHQDKELDIDDDDDVDDDDD